MTKKMNSVRRLTILLIASGSLNIFILSLAFYWTMKERPPTPYYELKPAKSQDEQMPLAIDHSNGEVIRVFKKMPFDWLVKRLQNKQLVENGYTQRDLALASLVAFHHFDLKKALSNLSPPQQKRMIVYGSYRDGKEANLLIYPGLADHYFDVIEKFATTEKFPLTPKGLFLALRKEKNGNPLLVDAFVMTPEFHAVELLFGRSEVKVDKSLLIDVIVEGDWSGLTAFAETQRVSQDLSAAKRQKFLLDYIKQGSKHAAWLLLKVDGEFAASKLDDTHVVMILQLQDESNPEAEIFIEKLVNSPRSDEVLKLAAARYYEFSGRSRPDVPKKLTVAVATAPKEIVEKKSLPIAKEIPKQLTKELSKPNPQEPQKVAIKQKVPVDEKKVSIATKTPAKPVDKVVISKATLSKTPAERKHVVEDGDTLWKISRKYNVDIQQIKASNKLESDTLRPGKTLRIP